MAPQLPSRTDLANEWTAFQNNRVGRCRWQKRKEVISELFEGTKKYKDCGIIVEEATLKWPMMTSNQQQTGTGERRFVSPTRVSRPRYGSVGGFRESMVRRLSLPPALEKVTVDLCNASLAKQTWRCYGSAERAAWKCGMETGMDMSPPWTEGTAVAFVAHLSSRNLAASTIAQYLSGIKSLHARLGCSLKPWESFILKNALRGKRNTEGPKKQKVPMSPGLMLVLRQKIKFSPMKPADKTLSWAVATALYAGSLRGGEVLGELESEFDTEKILMVEDVVIKKVKDSGGVWRKYVEVRVKNPKEIKGISEVKVEMFASDNVLCPVRAIERALKHCRPNKPFAMREGGAVMTKNWMNKLLRRCLKEVVNYDLNTVSSHSFRSGLASAMARHGYTDEEIQRQVLTFTGSRKGSLMVLLMSWQGRWASSAFLAYLKLGRSTRLDQQQRLAKAMSDIANRELMENPAMEKVMKRKN